MSDPSPTEQSPQRVKRLSPYLLPIFVCLIGAVLIFTMALAPLGIIVLILGLIWGAVAAWIARASRDTEPPRFPPHP